MEAKLTLFSMPDDVVKELKKRARSPGQCWTQILRDVLGLPTPRNYRLYDVSDLKVGGSKAIPWRVDENGVRISQTPIHQSIRDYGQFTGRKFKVKHCRSGLRVERIF